MVGGIAQGTDDLVHLEERAWPAMGQDERQGIGPRPRTWTQWISRPLRRPPGTAARGSGPIPRPASRSRGASRHTGPAGSPRRCRSPIPLRRSVLATGPRRDVGPDPPAPDPVPPPRRVEPPSPPHFDLRRRANDAVRPPVAATSSSFKPRNSLRICLAVLEQGGPAAQPRPAEPVLAGEAEGHRREGLGSDDRMVDGLVELPGLKLGVAAGQAGTRPRRGRYAAGDQSSDGFVQVAIGRPVREPGIELVVGLTPPVDTSKAGRVGRPPRRFEDGHECLPLLIGRDRQRPATARPLGRRRRLAERPTASDSRPVA